MECLLWILKTTDIWSARKVKLQEDPGGWAMRCLSWVHQRKVNMRYDEYHQTSNIRCTKSQNLNVSHLILQLSLPHLLKPGVKSRMKMWLEQRTGDAPTTSECSTISLATKVWLILEVWGFVVLWRLFRNHGDIMTETFSLLVVLHVGNPPVYHMKDQ